MKIINYLLLLILMDVTLAYPPTFHQFYGEVKYTDETDVENNVSVTAIVNGIGFSTVVSDGVYGYLPLFLVENANDNDMIYFYINGVEKVTSTFIDGSVSKIDFVLSVDKKINDTLPPPEIPPPSVPPPAVPDLPDLNNETNVDEIKISRYSGVASLMSLIIILVVFWGLIDYKLRKKSKGK